MSERNEIMPQKPMRREPSPHSRRPGEAARDRALYAEEMRKKRLYRRQRRAENFAYALRILLLGIAASAVAGLLMFFFVKRDFAKAPDRFSYSLTVKKNDKSVSLKKGTVIRDNTLYVSLDDLSDLIGFKLMGDVKIMNAVFTDISDQERVSVYLNTDSAVYGKTVRLLGAQSYFSGSDGDVFVPVSFLENAFEGAELTGVQKGSRIDYTLTVSDACRLAYSNDVPATLPDISGIDTSTQPDMEFISDLSAYEKYMDPENADEYIRLINTEHPLGKDYIPPDLTNISDTRKDRKAVQMREYAAKALDAMFIEMRANGFTDVSVTSAYRSYDYQTQRFNDTMNNYMKSYNRDTAYAKTAAEIALPGCSEHQSGLCADLHNLPAASQSFESKEAYKWLVAHCADFGFILRYPKDKEDITKIIFEPWHYRFVGRYHAKRIMQSGLCLEEYCEQYNVGLE